MNDSFKEKPEGTDRFLISDTPQVDSASVIQIDRIFPITEEPSIRERFLAERRKQEALVITSMFVPHEQPALIQNLTKRQKISEKLRNILRIGSIS